MSSWEFEALKSKSIKCAKVGRYTKRQLKISKFFINFATKKIMDT